MTRKQYEAIKPYIQKGNENGTPFILFTPGGLNDGKDYYDDDYICAVRMDGEHTVWNFAQLIFSLFGKGLSEIL